MIEAAALITAMCVLAALITWWRGQLFTEQYLYVHAADSRWFYVGCKVEVRGRRYRVIRREQSRDVMVLRRCWR